MTVPKGSGGSYFGIDPCLNLLCSILNCVLIKLSQLLVGCSRSLRPNRLYQSNSVLLHCPGSTLFFIVKFILP
jgi:hypothetical protein